MRSARHYEVALEPISTYSWYYRRIGRCDEVERLDKHYNPTSGSTSLLSRRTSSVGASEPLYRLGARISLPPTPPTLTLRIWRLIDYVLFRADTKYSTLLWWGTVHCVVGLSISDSLLPLTLRARSRMPRRIW